MEFAKLPQHVAFIMDGNGRWARFALLEIKKRGFLFLNGETPYPPLTNCLASIGIMKQAKKACFAVAQRNK